MRIQSYLNFPSKVQKVSGKVNKINKNLKNNF
jgi:hypothetical protein